MADLFHFLCPHCEKTLAAAHEHVGSVTACPFCEADFEIPETPDSESLEPIGPSASATVAPTRPPGVDEGPAPEKAQRPLPPTRSGDTPPALPADSATRLAVVLRKREAHWRSLAPLGIEAATRDAAPATHLIWHLPEDEEGAGPPFVLALTPGDLFLYRPDKDYAGWHKGAQIDFDVVVAKGKRRERGPTPSGPQADGNVLTFAQGRAALVLPDAYQIPPERLAERGTHVVLVVTTTTAESGNRERGVIAHRVCPPHGDEVTVAEAIAGVFVHWAERHPNARLKRRAAQVVERFARLGATLPDADTQLPVLEAAEPSPADSGPPAPMAGRTSGRGRRGGARRRRR